MLKVPQPFIVLVGDMWGLPWNDLRHAIMFRWITHEAQYHTSSCSNVAARFAASCPRRLPVIICIGTKNRCNSKLQSQHMHLLTTGVVLHASKAEDAFDCYMNTHVHMICMLTPMYQAAQNINHRCVAS